MIDKIVRGMDEAVADIRDGATLLIGGFGGAGVPFQLIDAVIRTGARDLTIVTNNSGNNEEGIALFFKHRRASKLCCSFPVTATSYHFRQAFEEGGVELELIPQGTLAERIRAAGAGVGGFYTPTGVGTLVAEGKETRQLDGRTYVLERPLKGDFALVRAHRADRYGNLAYKFAMRNFNPVMATAATTVIAEVDQIVGEGEIAPDDVHTPGIYVDRVVQIGNG
ncbi:MAG: 3-oxoacid CoA-transferase subunit A [Chloroflexota bacterium]